MNNRDEQTVDPKTMQQSHQKNHTHPWNLYPAIDLHDGRVVRLTQGRFDAAKEYAADPVSVAQRWWQMGARWLHIVDLDAARTGKRRHRQLVAAVRSQVPIKIQYGGGVRTIDDATELIETGIDRVVLGTAAFENPTLLETAVTRFGEHIAVGLDVRGQTVAVRGWESEAGLSLDEALDFLNRYRVPCVIITSIRSDGTLRGPDIALYESCLAKLAMPVIASGGVRTSEDVAALHALRSRGLAGVIVGRALYEGTLDLKECLSQWS